MRLIDADSLKEKFMSDAFREMVDNEPTAYNVEKVVEQLSNAKLGGRCDAGVVAKEIVRNGGKE